jgi:L-fuconolactonase
MFGSDWPVCLPACSYRKWIEAVSSLIAALSLDEQDLILGNVACKAYGLSF